MDAACTRLVGTLETAGAGPLPGGLGWRLGRGGGGGLQWGSLDPGSSILGNDRVAGMRPGPRHLAVGGGGWRPCGSGVCSVRGQSRGRGGVAWERCGVGSGVVLRSGCEEPSPEGSGHRRGGLPADIPLQTSPPAGPWLRAPAATRVPSPQGAWAGDSRSMWV